MSDAGQLPSSSDKRHDEVLRSLLEQHAGDPQKLLSTVVHFLERETAFVANPNEKRQMSGAPQHETDMAAPAEASGIDLGTSGKQEPEKAAPTPSAAPTAAAAKSVDPAVVPAAASAVSGAYDTCAAGAPAAASAASMRTAGTASSAADPAVEPAAGSAVSGAYDTSAGGAPAAAAAGETAGGPSEGGSAEGAQPMELADDDAEAEGTGLEPNAGNGYDTEKYTWSQTLADATVSVQVPAGTKGRGCQVTIARSTIEVGLKGEEPILKGELAAEVKPDDCIWNLIDGRLLEVSLAKSDAMRWWPHVLKGEPELNLQKVQPENSRISDLDGDTRATVEKMMYDQQQKQRGLPTADEQKKQDMLKKFMDAHPEMDFSNAKFN